MLKRAFYQDSKSFWLFVEQRLKNSKVVVVTPSPQMADRVRKYTQNSHHTVVTMGNFTNDLALSLGFDEKNIKKKSELILYLSSLAKKQFKLSHQEFFTAFNVFTELRGVSSDIVVVESILDEYLPSVREWVLSFYEALMKKNWLDEHGLYVALAEALDQRDTLESSDIEYIFYGFKHITGSQVDLLVKLSKVHDVYVPYRKSIHEKSWGSDWIEWLAFDAEDIEVECHNSAQSKKDSISIVDFHSGGMSLKLADIFNESSTPRDIVIGQKKLEPSHILMIPHNHLNFKISYDFFEIEEQEILSYIHHSDMKIGSVRKRLETLVAGYDFQSSHDFKKLKVVLLLMDIIGRYNRNEESYLDVFDLKVIFEVLKLDIPRLNLTSFLTNSKSQSRLLGLEDISDPYLKDGSILILSSQFSTFRGVSTLYSEKVEKFISSISPMRRSELEDDWLQEDILEVLQDKRVTILLEKDLLEKEPRWRELFSKFSNESKVLTSSQTINFTKPFEAKKVQNVERPTKSNHYSATRIQAYIDCDLAYYYKYVKPIFPNFLFETELEPRELGTLEHDVIAEYYNKNTEVDLTSLNLCVSEKFDDYLIRENKRLEEIKKESLLSEIFHFSKTGLEFLYHLKDVLKLEDDFSFEAKIHELFPDLARSGAIDCSYISQDKVVVIDFKRSKGSVPKEPHIMEFIKIQFLFYLNLVKQKTKIHEPHRYFMGYLCLGSIEKSLVWADDLTQEELMAAGYPKSIFKKSDKLFDVMESYPAWERKIIEQMESQVNFSPNPREKSVCTFCELKNICDRGIHSES